MKRLLGVLKVMLLQLCAGFAYFLIGTKVLSQVLKSKSDWVVCEIKYKNTSRTIDIDLIAFDSEIIATEKLEIPHPLMQNRNFVLLPFKI
jgi:7,8-dihydro-6-hydroxymethylpterin-pyrophosphokinase